MKLSELLHSQSFIFIGDNPKLTICETRNESLFRFAEYRNYRNTSQDHDELRYRCAFCHRFIEVNFYLDFIMDCQCNKFTNCNELPQMCDRCAFWAMKQLNNEFICLNSVYQIRQMWAEARARGLYHE
jgi:hypothetical protein